MFILSIIFVVLSLALMMKASEYGCGKRPYKTRKEAESHKDADQIIYMCWDCETWHLKNKDENP